MMPSFSWQAKSDWLLHRLIGRRSWTGWLSSPTPTADIYFLNAMDDLIAPRGPVKRHGPNMFGHEGIFVILRYANEGELAEVEAAGPRKVFYVVDDDLAGLSRCSDLPFGYRARLGRFQRDLMPRILAMRPTIVAPNRLILEKFPAHDTLLLHPSHCAVRQQFDHFEADAPIEVVFTGTRSHLADLEAISPALDGLCARFPNIRLTAFLGRHLPQSLKRHANVVSHRALGWPAYREHLQSARYHIAIAPFRRMPLNECRSHNKIHDHAALGAVGLYGDIGPYRETVTDGLNGFVLPSEPRAWLEKMSELILGRGALRRIAEEGGALSRSLGDPERLRTFWRPKLGL